MDKYEQLKREFDLLQNFCSPWLAGNDSEFEYYIESAMLRIWSGAGRYSEDYAKAVLAVSGKDRSAAQIMKAMLDSAEPAEQAKVPSFFARMVSDDFDQGTRQAKQFVNDLKSLLAGAAFINGDFTIEESNLLSAELKKLMTYAISKGVKIDYSTGRIRERITPLKEDSYVSPGDQALVSSELIFDALDRDFLRPGRRKDSSDPGSGTISDPYSDGADAGGSGPAGSGNGSFGGDGSPGGSNKGPSGADQPGDPTSSSAGPDMAIRSEAEAVEDPRTMEELLEELDSLVGLTGIKEDIRSLMNFITITKLREERGLSVPTISYHLVFTGNPGTGKTTVARLVAGLYHRIGILSKGQLVEADRSQLVGGYLGQTAIKTMDVINKAMGGVLFIDEAYALVNDDQDSFGKEAIETILKAMEDHRDEIVVIVAGYTELMHEFIESNPGFRSRFSKYFEFPDYTGDELLQIFLTFCKKNGYHLNAEAEAYLLLQFNEMYEHRDSHFGNGRTARNIFEKAINQQANRLAELAGKGASLGADKTDADADAEASADAHVTDEMLQELTKEDLEAAVEAENRKIQLPS